MITSRPYPSDAASQNRVSLLAEVVEVLVEELAVVGNRDWDDLPDLKKKKVVLASRLHAVDWSPTPREQEASDLKTLRFLVTELERHVRQKIQGHLELLGLQVAALQDQHQYWLECMNISFRRFYEAIPVS